MQEDYLTMIIAKDKNLWPNPENIDVEDIDKSIFNYLEEREHLNTPRNQEKFSETVNDFYHMAQEEFFEENEEYLIPSPQIISDMIDEENINIISLFVLDTEKRNSEDRIENIINIYIKEISSQLLYSVIEALDTLGLPFSDKDHPNDKAVSEVRNKCFYDPYQIRMFGDEIYDRRKIDRNC